MVLKEVTPPCHSGGPGRAEVRDSPSVLEQKVLSRSPGSPVACGSAVGRHAGTWAVGGLAPRAAGLGAHGGGGAGGSWHKDRTLRWKRHVPPADAPRTAAGAGERHAPELLEFGSSVSSCLVFSLQLQW